MHDKIANNNDFPIVVEEDIKKWWVKLKDHRSYSNKHKRCILVDYYVGEILSFIRPDQKVEPPHTLRIAICGLTGAGKSSFIMTLLTALEERGAVQWWRTDLGQPTSEGGQRIVRQLGPEQHKIKVGLKSGKDMYIELVDNRGLLDETNIQEAVRIVEGQVPMNTQVGRMGDMEYVSKFTNVFPKNAEMFHLTMLLIPADLPDDKISLYVRLRALIRQTTIPVLHVFTKCDTEDAATKIESLMSSLGLREQEALQVTCYSKSIADFNEDINSQALFVLLWAIILADSRGLPIKQETNWVVQQREVTKFVKDTSKAVKNRAASEGIMTCAIVIVILLLIANLLK